MEKRGTRIVLILITILGFLLILLVLPPKTGGMAITVEDTMRSVLCVDSDGNSFKTGIFVKGDVTLYTRAQGLVTRRYYGTRTDNCLNNEILSEQSCSSTGLWVSSYRQCPPGYSCYDGACRR